MLRLINPIVRHATHKFKFLKMQSLQMNRITMPLQRDKGVLIPAFLLCTGVPPILPAGTLRSYGQSHDHMSKTFCKESMMPQD